MSVDRAGSEAEPATGNADGRRDEGGGGNESAAAEAAEAAEAVEALRRRVYGPAANASDVARYALAVERTGPAASADRVGPGAATPGAVLTGPVRIQAVRIEAVRIKAVRIEAVPTGAWLIGAVPMDAHIPGVAVLGVRSQNRGRTAVIGAAALVVVLGLIVGMAQRPTPPPSPPAATPTALSVDAATRAAFVRALATGRTAGLGSWLATRQRARSPATGRAGTDVTEHTGSGTSTVVLNPPTSAARDGGRATVVLVTADDAATAWSVFTLALAPSHAVYLQPLAHRGAQQTAGVPTAATFHVVASAAPMRLRVVAPKGVRWDAAVIFSP